MQHAQIPPLSPDEIAQNRALTQHIAQTIHAHGGAIPFSQFMQLALYAPHWGYYTAASHKIGAAGDFITAPTLSPLFAQTLAQQLLDLLPQTAGNIYEFGAGTGALAADLLRQLSGSLKNYFIVELSPDLAQRQREHIAAHSPEFAERVVWLNALPEYFDGVILGNEVLDAMPIERVRQNENGQFERAFVAMQNDDFIFEYKPLDDENLFQAATEYYPPALPHETYTSELHPQQHAFVATLAEKLRRGAMIFVDYGFDAPTYYHPQRADGTLIGHHKHHSIHSPFFRVGLTDLTAHVNFSDIADAGVSSSLDLIGYTTQANFLFNLGILDWFAAQFPQTDTADYVQAAHALHILTAQHEMGELFKVIAFGKDVDVDWRGFTVGDMCHKL